MEFKEISKDLVKKIKSLRKKSGRDEHGLFIAEGSKICNEVLNSIYQPINVILPGNAGEESKDLALKIAVKFKTQIYKVPRKIFESLCDTETPQDILICLKIQKNVPIPDKSFVALDKVSDPGNVGTIIRTAKWFGFEQVILNESCADIFNPKTVRSSMGAIMQLNCQITHDLGKYIHENFNNHLILGTFLDAGKDLSEVDKRKKLGIIFGNESTGISEELKPIIDEKVNIYGSGNFESLNVSVAAGIVMYELSTKK